MLENLENKFDKKSKSIVNSICIFTTFRASSLAVELKFLQETRGILSGLLEPIQSQLQELHLLAQKLEKTAIEKKSDIGFKYALGLKEATTIMLSNNASEKESLKIVMTKKLKTLDNQINSLSKKLEQKENIDNSPNTNKRKDHQTDEESSAQFSNLLSKDSNQQGSKKQQKHDQIEEKPIFQN